MIGVGSFDVTSVDVASIHIADSEGLVDSFLGARYIVPFTTVPQLITGVTSDLAIFKLMAENTPSVPEFIQSRYDRAIDILKALRDGDQVLIGASAVASGDNEAWSSNIDYHSTFSPVLDPLDQAVDKDWVEAEQDARVDDT
jgi:phage gp36-like protein